jgi:hypothetical protein
MRKSTYYAHVDALWKGIFASAGMSKPEIGSDLAAWAEPTLKAADATLQHLPQVPAPGCVTGPSFATLTSE